jgi:predicted RNase H-like HicB family nuclease
MKYAVIFEKGERNWSAYVPDLPGCVATGATRAETARNIDGAIVLHIHGLREDGLAVPKPSTAVAYSRPPLGRQPRSTPDKVPATAIKPGRK